MTIEVAGGSDRNILDDDLREELGDPLLQIYSHAEIASTQNRFGIEDVARDICDKLVRRHPGLDGEDDPADMMGTWEAAKRAEKQRRSALRASPSRCPPWPGPTRWSRGTRHVRLDVPMADEPITAEQAGRQTWRSSSAPKPAGWTQTRPLDALRALEDEIRRVEGGLEAVLSWRLPAVGYPTQTAGHDR